MAYGMYHIGEEELPGGYTIEWEYDPDMESPRTFDNLGHMYCWGGRIVSPDENPYRDECEFVKSKLLELFTGRELEKAVRDGMFGSLRFAVGEDGAEHLESLCVSTVAGPSWYPVDDWEEWRDEQELAEAIADCPEAVELLSRKMVILTVYRLEHSGVAYSTRPFNDPWDSGAVGFIWADEDDVSNWFAGLRASRDGVARILSDEVEDYSAWANGETYAVFLLKGDVQVDACFGYIGDDALEDAIGEMRSQAKAAA